MSAPVEFKIVRRDGIATCACGMTIQAREDGAFEVSPHLRAVHNFGTGEIDFQKTFEVICPPMIGMSATERVSS